MDEENPSLVLTDLADDSRNKVKQREHITTLRAPRKGKCIKTLSGRLLSFVPRVKAR
jgi:hypothetical protein